MNIMRLWLQLELKFIVRSRFYSTTAGFIIINNIFIYWCKSAEHIDTGIDISSHLVFFFSNNPFHLKTQIPTK